MTQCSLVLFWDLVGSSSAIICSVMAYCASVIRSWSVTRSVMAYCVPLGSMTGTLEKRQLEFSSCISNVLFISLCFLPLASVLFLHLSFLGYLRL